MNNNDLQKSITIQKSFEQDDKKLYVVSTPIGNLEDITLRAIKTLGNVGLILCEDTRVSSKLLSHLQIKKPLLSFFEHNSKYRLENMMELFEQYKSIAIISDAGTPLINDPGYTLVGFCIKNGIDVISVPGVSSVTSAISVSGLSVKSFLFCGFVERKVSQLQTFMKSIEKYEGTLVFLESPNRIHSSINNLYNILGDTDVVLCRELTKMHETIYRGTLKTAKDFEFDPRGEYVICVSKDIKKLDVDPTKYYNNLLKKGFSSKEALHATANDLNMSKNELYKLIKC